KDIEEKENRLISLKTNLTTLQSKIDNLEERFYVIQDMDKELFDKFMGRYREEKLQINKEIQESGFSSSNLPNSISSAVSFTSQIPYLWESSGVKQKEKLQKIIFPDGIYLDSGNKAFRTERINLVFR